VRSFRSDNNAGLTPEALRALMAVNASDDHMIGYGDDAYTQRAIEVFKSIFGGGCAIFFVATGTAANALAIASLTQPWQQVLCHAHSHYNDDESTAPERFTHCRTTAITPDHPHSKLTPGDIERCANLRGDVHQPQPGVFTLSNSTEFGTVYTPAEIRALAATAHAMGYRVHMDGARFANAVASLGCDPREITVNAGLDAISFGGTKNGLAFGEAVIFFPQGDGSAFQQAVHAFPFHRKATGHLLSKHRFVSAPFAATLGDGSWLRHAAHANAMAAELSRGLERIGLKPRFPTQANGVFVQLPAHVESALRQRGHGFYPFGDPDWQISRLMCSFNTTPADVQNILSDVESALRQG
jgi:threonine aldolase